MSEIGAKVTDQPEERAMGPIAVETTGRWIIEDAGKAFDEWQQLLEEVDAKYAAFANSESVTATQVRSLRGDLRKLREAWDAERKPIVDQMVALKSRYWVPVHFILQDIETA